MKKKKKNYLSDNWKTFYVKRICNLRKCNNIVLILIEHAQSWGYDIRKLLLRNHTTVLIDVSILTNEHGKFRLKNILLIKRNIV